MKMYPTKYKMSQVHKSHFTKLTLERETKQKGRAAFCLIAKHCNTMSQSHLFLLFRAANQTKYVGDFSSGKKALVLGAGYVSAPVIEYLTRDPDLGVTVAAAIKVSKRKKEDTQREF